jgi:hypothetical protein
MSFIKLTEFCKKFVRSQGIECNEGLLITGDDAIIEPPIEAGGHYGETSG